jgi:GT2 family glycosyltransferase
VRPQANSLAKTVHSVLRQTYPHWELCIADDASTRPAELEMLSHLEVLAHTEPRIRVLRRPARGGIVAASQSAIALSQAPWLSFLDHDDRLHTDALLELASMLRVEHSLECLYTDSRMTDRNGVMLHQYHKPDWAPETLLHLNYINHFSVVRRDVFDAVGGLRMGYDGSQDWDLWLRLASRVDLQVGHVAQPLLRWRHRNLGGLLRATKPYAWDAALPLPAGPLRTPRPHPVQCRRVDQGIGLRTTWRAPLQPLTAIIPTHRNPQDLQRLLASLAASAYPGLEVLLIGNNVAPDDAHTHRLLQDAAQHPRWRVVIDNQPCNWAALNNAAARLCHTPWLLFLNDDIELGAPDTLEQLARYLSLDAAIGAVGARLDYGPEQGGGIQHDGIATDPTWVARNICDLQDGKGLGIPRNVSAVTGACLLTPRAVFERCGGFEERLAVSYNDVDYGLHVRRLGYRVVQASDVVCIHRESRTRGGLDSDAKREELAREGQFMRDKWGDFLRETYRLQYIQRFAGSRIVSIPDA